jgi:hypothetical protein
MVIDPIDLIKEYYEKEIEGKYPSLTLEKVSTICRAPFMFFRKMMESMDFPLIHVKYFGKFVVFPGRAKGIIKGLEYARDKGLITQEEFELKSTNLKLHIDEYEAESPNDSQRTETPD